MDDIIQKLKEINLKGRGGANFPVGLKWELVKNAPGTKKYIICNGAEGEPGVLKDGYILEHYPEYVIGGIKCALDLFYNSEAYIYLNKNYFYRFADKLRKLIAKLPINVVKEKGGYLAGEETTLLESLEGDRLEPRLRPPYPTEQGLWSFPTLINNVETFYAVYLISQNKYEYKRFFTIRGEVKKRGNFELNENLTIKEVLKETANLPVKKFFVQVGGEASGEFLTMEEIDQPLKGTAAITVYDLEKTDKLKLLRQIAKFFLKEHCGKCLTCREGVYRLNEILNKRKPDLNKALVISEVLKETSFCGLGSGCGQAAYSLITKFLNAEI